MPNSGANARSFRAQRNKIDNGRVRRPLTVTVQQQVLAAVPHNSKLVVILPIVASQVHDEPGDAEVSPQEGMVIREEPDLDQENDIDHNDAGQQHQMVQGTLGLACMYRSGVDLAFPGEEEDLSHMRNGVSANVDLTRSEEGFLRGEHSRKLF